MEIEKIECPDCGCEADRRFVEEMGCCYYCSHEVYGDC